MQDQLTLPESSRRELAVERSQKISRALHDAARKARQTVRGSTVWQPGFSRAKRGTRMFTLLSALLICVVPTILFSIYISLFASDQYEVETRFAIKSKSMLLSDALGSLTGMASLQQAQDSQIISDYVESRTMVEKIDRELNLRAIYSRPEIDYVSRFAADDPVEELVRYWRKRVKIRIEMPANIVSISIRAFQPGDALKIGQAVMRASEALVNELSDRSRRDAVAKAQEEVDRAEKLLISVRDEVRLTREQEGLIDAKRSGDETVKMIGELRMERIKLESEMQVQSRSLSPQAPQMQTLRARLDALSGQINGLEKSLTAANSSDPTLAQSLVRFDKTRLNQEWAEKYYTIVAGSLEKARMDSERQQVYLESFVQPVMPHHAEYPRRLWLISIVGACSLLVWFIVAWIHSLVYG